MAKSMTVGKRENEKKRLAKREEKQKKKESRKLSGTIFLTSPMSVPRVAPTTYIMLSAFPHA